MDKSKKDAILAFYNLFSDELQTELCTSLLDVRFLLHTVVNFIGEGKLEFRDHSKFGFREAVSFLHNVQPHINKRLTSRLDWVLAENGDALQVGKILLLLIYVIRLERSTEMIGYMKILPKQHNRTIAYMVGQLDQEDFDDRDPDVLASTLTASVERRKSSPFTNAASNNSGSLYRSPLAERNNSFLRSLEETPQLGCHIAPDGFGREVFGDDSTRSNDSPIACVVRSPRGKHVERIRQQARKIADLERVVKTLEREYDEFKSNAENELREKTVELKRLQRKLELFHDKVSVMESMKNELVNVTSVSGQQARQIERLEGELSRVVDVRTRLVGECEKARERIEMLEERNRMLDDTAGRLRRELDDARQIVDFTNAKLSSAECQLDALRAKFSYMCDEHRDELSAKDRHWQMILAQKTEELEKQLETAEIVKEQHFAEVEQLRDALKSAKQTQDGETTIRLELVETRDKLAFIEMQAAKTMQRLENVEAALSDKTTQLDKLEKEKSEIRLENSNLMEAKQSVEDRLGQLLGDYENLKNRLDCNEAMFQFLPQNFPMAFDSPKQTSHSVDEDFDHNYYTPKTGFDLQNDEPEPAIANSLQTIDICHMSEDDWLSQTTTNGADQTLMVERSSLDSRHAMDGSTVEFLRQSDGCHVRSTYVQTTLSGDPRRRRSSLHKVMKYVRSQLRASKSSFEEPDDAVHGSMFRSRSCTRSMSSVGVIPQSWTGETPLRPFASKTIDFNENPTDVQDTVDMDLKPTLNKITEESSRLESTPVEVKKKKGTQRRRSILPMFSR